MSGASVDLVTVISDETEPEIERFGAGLREAWSRLSPAERGKAILVSSGAAPALIGVATTTLEHSTGTVPELMVLPSNRGSAHAYNVGFGRASALSVALLDPDGAPDADLLRRLVEVLEANPDAAAVAGQIVDFGAARTENTKLTSEVEWVPAGATLYRREAFASVGGFDELFAGYCEDMDFGHRVRAAGWRCLRVGGAVFRHRTGASPSFHKFVVLTEYMMVWRHIHFSRRVTAKSWLAQLPIIVRSNRGSRGLAFVGTAAGLVAYFRHIPSCERRRA